MYHSCIFTPSVTYYNAQLISSKNIGVTNDAHYILYTNLKTVDVRNILLCWSLLLVNIYKCIPRLYEIVLQRIQWILQPNESIPRHNIIRPINYCSQNGYGLYAITINYNGLEFEHNFRSVFIFTIYNYWARMISVLQK